VEDTGGDVCSVLAWMYNTGVISWALQSNEN